MKLESFILFGFMAFVLVLCFASLKCRKRKLKLADPEIKLNVEVADNILLRAKGLMGRKYLKRTEAMLFVFGRPARHSLWMFNTPISLDAIFFSEDGTAVEVMEMDANSIKGYRPKEKAKYILEVKKGVSKRIIVGKTHLSL